MQKVVHLPRPVQTSCSIAIPNSLLSLSALLGATDTHSLPASAPAVPWTFGRLGAGLLGIHTPDEAPVGFLRSSLTPATFWRNYHTS